MTDRIIEWKPRRTLTTPRERDGKGPGWFAIDESARREGDALRTLYGWQRAGKHGAIERRD